MYILEKFTTSICLSGKVRTRLPSGGVLYSVTITVVYAETPQAYLGQSMIHSFYFCFRPTGRRELSLQCFNGDYSIVDRHNGSRATCYRLCLTGRVSALGPLRVCCHANTLSRFPIDALQRDDYSSRRAVVRFGSIQ